MPMRVIVEPHNPCWAGMFDTEAARVSEALGSNVVAVHHIGSTAVATLWAKPIIDLLVEVTEIAAVDGRNQAMEALGYEPMGEFGIAGRRYFRKDDSAGTRTHQVHTFAAGSAEALRHLAFRDFLRAHPTWAAQYSDLKRRLARSHPDDIEQYMDGKDAFIRELDRRAAARRVAVDGRQAPPG